MKLLSWGWRVIFSGLLLASLLSACGGGNETPPESSTKARNVSPGSSQAMRNQVVSASTTLGLELMGDDIENRVVAPFSASLSLARLQAGARGETLAALKAKLHLEGVASNVYPAFNELDLSISSRLSASSINGQTSGAYAGAWAQSRYGFLITYLDTLAEHFGLNPARVDFDLAATEATQAVQSWALQASGGLSTPVDIGRDTRMVLGDAVRLNCAWTTPFDPALTTLGSFEPLMGFPIDVPFMRRNAVLPQTAGDGYLALALPLQGNLQFLVVLPEAGRFAEVQGALTAERLGQIALAMTPAQVQLAIPTFTMETSTPIYLGIAEAKGYADFSGLDGTRDLFVSSTVHHAKLSINEAGVQAASATLLALDDLDPESWSYNGMILTAELVVPQPEPSVQAVLGRPFIFAVRDSVTGSILFIGRVLFL